MTADRDDGVFTSPLLSRPLTVQETRGLHVDLCVFLAGLPAPEKPLTGRESWGGDAGLLKKGRFRKG